jgi:hypothetical protein
VADQKSNGNKPAKRKLNLSPEERERRRLDMIEKRKAGKVGPEYGKLGGRPRKPRAAELLAQEAEKHKEQMLQVLKDSIDSNQPIGVRQKGLDQWLAIEREERRLEMDEDEHIAKMSKDELAAMLASKFQENPLLQQMFMKRMTGEDAIDVEGEEIPDAEVVDD